MSAKNKWIVLVTFCSLLVGTLLMLQLKAQAKAPKEVRPDNILPVLIERNQENAQLHAELDKLNAELQKLKQGVDAAILANDQLKRARLLAGLEPVKGPGIKITLDDSKYKDIDIDEVSQYIIHEEYLRAIVNALWNAGAEAISINGQRVTVQTEILCNYNVMNINGKPQTPPFVIYAIGEPQKLQAGVGFVDWDFVTLVQKYGIGFKVEPEKEVKISEGRYHEFRFATPSKEGN
ncbi:MAG TPA: DUF881 domain-containing protein [Verrucomicrobiae bacterium]|nr:DUF881 domain-containing protein [Verrucomicrobiae bacterium]